MAERLRPEEMTEPPSDDPPSKRMSSVANVDVDDILKEIAKALYKNSDIDDLGKALGFGPGEIGRQIAENDKRGGNHMGTLDLLRMWQNRQTPSTEKAALRSALLEAGFDNLADQHLSTPVPESDQYTVQQTTEDCSKNKGDNEAMPSEMMKLREQLKRRYRKEFGEIKTSPVDSESRTWLQYIYDSLVLMLGFAREKEEPIDYDGSFKFIKTDTQKGFVTRLAFIGEAGVGKSTLFAKIALDWAEGKILQESFREIKESGFFGDTVMAHFPDDSEIKGEWVDAHVRKNQRKVLILLDGLDEAHIDIKKPNCNDAIVSIMRGERFIDTPVLISTRPFGADQIKSIMTINDHYTFGKPRLRFWLTKLEEVVRLQQQAQAASNPLPKPEQTAVTQHTCSFCKFSSTSKTDFENHLLTTAHKAMIFSDSDRLWKERDPPNLVQDGCYEMCKE
eukprot:XP_011681815.1 PREDICTED: uncharacterized protein LOC105446526 [Strongylocentrotus purpuratus]